MDTKVIGRRIGAFIIDWILATLVVIVVAIAMLESIDVSGGPNLGQDGCDLIEDEYPLCFYADENYVVGTGGDIVVLLLVGLGAWVALRVVPQAVNGRTLGKKVFGLRVVNQHGTAPGFGKSLLREFLWIVDGILFYVVALVTAASSKQNQRVGDMAASTFVVRASSTSASATPAPTAYMPPPAGEPVAPVGQPVWDPVRNAYVHRDPSGHEQIYDQDTGQWRDA